eukprot:28854-Rhodomonas_salina.1
MQRHFVMPCSQGPVQWQVAHLRRISSWSHITSVGNMISNSASVSTTVDGSVVFDQQSVAIACCPSRGGSGSGGFAVATRQSRTKAS